MVGEAVAKPGGDGAGHEEEHGAGEEEAVGDPFAVERAGLGVEGAEEALKRPADRWVEDAGVAGLPGDETEEEGQGDWKPGPEDGGDLIGFGVGSGGDEGRRSGRDRQGVAEFAEGDEAEEESGGGEDGEEVAEDKDELGELGPVEAGGDLQTGVVKIQEKRIERMATRK